MGAQLFAPLNGMLAAASTAEIIDKLARTPLSRIVILSLVLTLVRMAVVKYLRGRPRHQRYGVFNVVKWVDSFCDAVVYAAVVVFMLVRPFVLQTFYIPSGSMIDTLHVGDFVLLNKNIYRHSDPKPGEIVVFKPPASALYAHQDPDTDFIKRLVAAPGDTIEWKGKKLYRNGAPVVEPYADYTSPSDPEGPALPSDRWGEIDQADFKLIKDGDRYISVLTKGNAVNGKDLDAPFDSPLNVDVLTNGQGQEKPRDAQEALRWKNAPPAKLPAGHFLFMGDNRNGSLDGRYWGLVPRDSIIGKAEIIWMPMSRWRKLN